MNWRTNKHITAEQINDRLQELDELIEFTPTQQKEYDALEDKLRELQQDY